MRHIKLIFILLTVILFTVTCKKEHLTQTATPATATPIFYFNGMINGISTSIEAGINNYYMYSSYKQDSITHVYSFIGNLKQTTSNLNGIEIEINDYKVSAINGNTQPDSAFGFVNYSYYSVGVTDTVYNVSFTSSYINGTALTYSWNFGDGTTSNLANPTHAYSNAGNYNVCLTISGASCSNNICNSVNVGNSTAASENTKITSTVVSDTINFSAFANGFSPAKYIWDFGDGSPKDSIEVNNQSSHTYASGLYTVILIAKDSFGLYNTITYYNIAPAGYSGCITNYSVNSINSVITTGSTLRLSDVTINWTNAAGIVYTTNNNAAQPSSSYFKILSEEAYQNNINGQATRKLHVNFACTLYNGINSIQITQADAIIAVAYK